MKLKTALMGAAASLAFAPAALAERGATAKCASFIPRPYPR